MNCNILSDEVKEIFISDYADLSEIMTEYKFSFRYRRKRRKIISFYSLQIRPEREKLPRRVKLAVIFSMIIFAILIAGFVTYTYISGFYVDKHNEYALLTIDESSGSNIINEKFYLDMDLSDYEVEVLVDNQINYTVRYSYEDKYIVVLQTPINSFGDLRVDTEQAMIDIDKIDNISQNSIISRSRNGEYHFFCKFDKYVVEYNCNISEISEEILVKSTKFK